MSEKTFRSHFRSAFPAPSSKANLNVLTIHVRYKKAAERNMKEHKRHKPDLGWSDSFMSRTREADIDREILKTTFLSPLNFAFVIVPQ